MTDFFLLPEDRVPLPSGDADIAVPHGPPTYLGLPQPAGPDDGIVALTATEWDARARVARDGAARLEEVIYELAGVNSHNWYGETIEGRDFYQRVELFLDNWRNQIKAQITALNDLARDCEQAGRDLVATDVDNARPFEV
ncbi:MAG: hypothetical protein QM662_10445 [Gordonia sp. (in: high G+C Gram-positive bacteria)]